VTVGRGDAVTAADGASEETDASASGVALRPHRATARCGEESCVCVVLQFVYQVPSKKLPVCELSGGGGDLEVGSWKLEQFM
jgi:hypothetical protein